MTTEVRAQCPWLKVPLEIDFELGMRWDGSVNLTKVETHDAHSTIHVKGKKVFFEDLVHQIRKYTDADFRIWDEFDAPSEMRTNYEGDSGGPRTVDATIDISNKVPNANCT